MSREMWTASMRRVGWWIAALLAAALILFGSRLLALYVDWLWFGEMGQRGVFWTILAAQAQLALIFGTALFLVMLLNIWLARRTAPRLTPRYGEFPLRVRLGRMARAGLSLALLAGALAIGVLAALEATGHWDTWLRFRHPVPFDQTDPIFGRDLGFYVFTLPFWRFVYGRVFVGLLLVLAGTALVYYLDRAVEFLQGYARVASSVRAHLSILLGLLVLVKAWGYRLDAYELLLTPGGVVQGLGAGYTEVHARLPAINILFGLCLIAATAFFLNVHFRLLWLPVAALALVALASVTIGTGFPAFVQRFQVTPDEGTVQEPYIRHHLAHTRAAYGLDRVATRSFPAAEQLPVAAVSRNAGTIQNMRLWDYGTLRTAYQQLQGLQRFYLFEDVDIDRYWLNGHYRQVMLSARELAPENLPAAAQRWQNRRLEFTHGYGLVMSPVNEADASGRPILWVRNIPLETRIPLRIDRPQVYYGERTNEPVIVRTRVPEFDYSLGRSSRSTRYEGAGGIRIGSWLHRTLFASYLGDTNLLISDAITSESRLLMRRNIVERVKRLAPFLMYDRDPYLVVVDGRLVWIHDAFTTAATYPYSEPISRSAHPELWPEEVDPLRSAGRLNYIRNSVKVVTDAYDGTVRFYVADEQDPILRCYRTVFPATWRPIEELSPAVRAHLRYPETLFRIQARVFTLYHVTDPGTYFRKDDAWEVPDAPDLSGSAPARGPLAAVLRAGPEGVRLEPQSAGPMEPYYVTMRLPGEAREEFLLILPLNYLGKKNMAAWLAARSDGTHYGQLIAYVFPSGTQTVGPAQVAAFINQDGAISQQLTLWNQQGSTVIWGNLLVIPIETSLLYVVPLFLSAQEVAIPEMRRVVLWHGGRVVMEPTLPEAIQALFQGATLEEPPSPTPEGATAAARAAGAAAARVRQLVAAAARHLEQAEAAQKRGDWAGYGAALGRLRGTIRELRRATGASP